MGIGLFRGTVALAAALALSGCDENGQFSLTAPAGGDAGADVEVSRAVQLVERDVEAPEVFEVTEAGLWDGRPSLGGVWVAHPDVSDPERVIIRNRENGKFVIGALFRRERENPGPLLQVSSDAANALGLLPGAPSELNVTALRREEVQETPATASLDGAETTLLDAPAQIEATALDPISNAAAAIDAAEASAATAPLAEITPAAAQAAPAPSSDLSRPYIQIGIFSVEANATGTADRMRNIGIVPTVLAQESQGQAFWRVIVGPATTEAERAQLLDQVKAQGFTDAYFVTD